RADGWRTCLPREKTICGARPLLRVSDDNSEVFSVAREHFSQGESRYRWQRVHLRSEVGPCCQKYKPLCRWRPPCLAFRRRQKTSLCVNSYDRPVFLQSGAVEGNCRKPK